MFFVIPWIGFFFIFLSFLKKNIFSQETCWRSSLLAAYLIFGLLIVLSTEILSFFRLLSFGAVCAFWVMATILGIISFLYIDKDKKNLFSFHFKGTPSSEIYIVSGIGIFLVLVGLIALRTPPNNWDSMTYHMSRVMHWIQNKSVMNYPTHNIRQITYAPLAEFFILHFQILSFSDRFANLVQWFFMAGSLIGVSLIAKQLGADRKGQVLSSVMAATIPMAILQASSTQNDLVVGFWLICFVYFLLLLREKYTLTSALAAGASLGLALLTKGTAYIYAFPFMLWFLFVEIKTRKGKSIQSLGCIVILALIINWGGYMRMLNLNGKFLPSVESPRVVNELYSFPAFLSNTIRNIASQLTSPFESFNKSVGEAVDALHSLIGLDSGDHRTTIAEGGFRLLKHPFHEDHAGNFIHLVLIIVSGFLFLAFKRTRDLNKAGTYLVLLLVAFLMFNICLKWQQWGSRLQLPLFLLFSPFVAVVFSNLLSRKAIVSVCVALFLFSLPWVFYNQSRPLLGNKSIFLVSKNDRYFSNRPSLHKHYQNTADYLTDQGCFSIGLQIGSDEWEYPLWALLKAKGATDFTIRHIHVSNISSKYSGTHYLFDYYPCSLIFFGEKQALNLFCNGRPYVKTRSFNFIQVFMLDEDGQLAKQNLIYHLYKTWEYSLKIIQLTQIMKDQGIFTDPKALNQIVLLRAYQQIEAKLVDIEMLDTFYPELAKRFRDELLTGLQLYIIGFRAADPQQYEAGRLLITRWEVWFGQNKEGFDKLFQ